MLCKASLILDKYSPFSLLLTILFHERKIGKNRIDIESINKASVNFMNNPNFGINIRYWRKKLCISLIFSNFVVSNYKVIYFTLCTTCMQIS